MSETGDRSSRVDVDDAVSEFSEASSVRTGAAAAGGASSTTELSATTGPPRSMADDAILGAVASSSGPEPAQSPVPDDAAAASSESAAGTRREVDVESFMAPDPPAAVAENRPPRMTILGTGMKWRNKWKARIQEWAPNYEDECGPKMNAGCCLCSTLLLIIVAIFIIVPARSCSCPDGTRNCCDIENFTLAFGIMGCVLLGIMSVCCMFCFAMGYASQKMQQKEQGADEVRNAVREAMA